MNTENFSLQFRFKNNIFSLMMQTAPLSSVQSIISFYIHTAGLNAQI